MLGDVQEARPHIDSGPRQAPLPQPLPEPPAIPEPRDLPYCGTIRLIVDATDVARRIFRARAVIPVVSGGPMTLLYPKWLPGFHAPQAPIELLAGLEIHAAGEALRWIRHPVTVNAFTVDVPDGATSIEASFQFLSPTESDQGRVLVTQDMLMLPWNTVILYPAGHFARRIEVQASLKLPDGWDWASALEEERREGGIVHFKPVSLDALVDSPVMAGRHFRRIDLDDQSEVRLNLVADRPDLLDASDEQIARHRAVVSQCDALFGARHFRHYDVLLALSGELTSAGVEHHQSCEAVSLPTYFTDWETNFTRRDTFPHEYVHSWNGKHRRGEDSWSPCFEHPIRNSLMWVYEGQTQYWSQVLAARSGLWTAEQALGALAQTAATYDLRPGSQWRAMIDTTRDPIIAARSPLPWKSWQRSEDYYSEGALVWLDVDTRLRELSGEQRSLDDFARAFFGPDDGRPVTHTYSFGDVVETLAGIAPFDWQGLFERLITETRNGAPLAGLERGGYRLVFRAEPNAYTAGTEAVSGVSDLTFSIGLSVDHQGKISDVLWDGPAFDQGLISGASIIGVNGRQFSPEALKQAIRATASGDRVELVVKSGQSVRDISIDYDGGLRFPHLERIDDALPRLDRILAPR
jgi:predicted metalloprotease with PDZ domain